MERIDLHTHTLASDGSDAPADVVQKAAALGLLAVAVGVTWHILSFATLRK